MNLDKVDLSLIKILHDKDIEKEMSTTDLAKEIFDPKCRDDVISYNSMITSKLNKLIDYGVVTRSKTDSNKWAYYVDDDDILVTDGSIDFNYMGDKRSVDSDCIIFIPDTDGLYIISFLPEKYDV